MSDIPQAPDWWQANDGKWYPPQPGQDPFQQQPVGSVPTDPFNQPAPFGTPTGVTFGTPSPPGSGRGCASVGVIIAVITFLIVGGIIAVTVFAVDEANDAIDDSIDGDDPDEIDDVEVTACARDEGSLNWGTATLDVTNDSSETSSYFIDITFESRNGERQFGTGHANVTSLQPGRTTSVEASSLAEVPNRFKCTVTSVRRTSFG